MAAVSGIVTSPPYACETDRKIPHGNKRSDGDGGFRNYYSDNPKNIGNPQGSNGIDTYWQAVSDVYRECHKVLKPGGVLIVVLKAYIKAGRRVPLPQQTLKLLIRLGFEPLERIKAMLVKEEITPGLFGDVVRTKARKSFFRRLAEAKGSPPIDWEEVLVCQKPLDIP